MPSDAIFALTHIYGTMHVAKRGWIQAHTLFVLGKTGSFIDGFQLLVHVVWCENKANLG